MTVVLIEPPFGDYGVYVSVAERLLAGDILYDSVWNNKDPLYYFSLAASRTIGPLGGWLLELGWLLVLALGMQSVSKSLGLKLIPAVWVGFVFAPIVATGIGGPVPTGMALAVAVIALFLRQRYFLTGIVLAALIFVKITLFPVAAVMLIVFAFSSTLKNLLRVTGGFLTAIAVMCLLLLIREEAFPYLESLFLNVEYSQSITSGGVLSSSIERLSTTIDFSTQVVVLSSLLVVTLGYLRITQEPILPNKMTMKSIVGGLVSGFAVLAFTGQWTHHATVLLLPALLCIPMFVMVVSGISNAMSLTAVIATAITALLLAGVPSPGYTLNKVVYARANISALFAEPVEATLIKSTGTPTTYARVGQGDDNGHAFGLDEWTLECPRFMQFWWEPESVLERSLNCLPTAEVILVAPSGASASNLPEVWNDYIASVESLLTDQYQCKNELGYKVCRRY